MSDLPIQPEPFKMHSGSVMGFPTHAAYAEAIGEVHARPHPLISADRLVVQLSFMTDGNAQLDHAAMADLTRRLGIAVPDQLARHHSMKIGQGTIAWERHTEFSSYLWEGPLEVSEKRTANPTPFGNGFSAPGPVISGIRLEIRGWDESESGIIQSLDPASLCYSNVESGMASIVTDFRQDADGLTRIFVLDRGLTPARIGALAQRLIEIETYRTLAMLALPMAQELSGRMRRIENRLTQLTAEMTSKGQLNGQEQLAELTELAAELEAEAAASLYRFGASRAYDDIVKERLAALDEESLPGYDTWAGFLQRRVAPAMRTCRSVEERMANLSRKLTRATTLLRTWVDVEVKQQNRSLLASMNNRARLQLRLQQTVEGLSVAAVSYYIVGLLSYIGKAVSEFTRLKSEAVAAISVPIVVLLVFTLVRAQRQKHAEISEAKIE